MIKKNSLYFQKFNYSLANEDIQIEQSFAKGYHSIAAICGAGLRAFGLIHPNLKKLTVIDVSAIQLDYARLHLESIRHLSYHEYLSFFGFRFATLNQRECWKNQLLSEGVTSDFLKSLPSDWLKRGIIYSGRWESFIIRLGKIIRFFLDYDFKNQIYENPINREWPKKRLGMLLKIFANPLVIDRLLYRGQMAKTEKTNLEDLLIQGFDFVIKSPRVRESFLHQLMFLGGLSYQEGIDAIISESGFNQIKSYRGEISFVNMDLNNAFEKIEAHFWSCSDVLSYLSSEQINKFSLVLSTRKAQRIVFRSFMKHPKIELGGRFTKNIDLMELAHKEDLTRLYEFQIFDRISGEE